jgi:hypothetical protein
MVTYSACAWGVIIGKSPQPQQPNPEIDGFPPFVGRD